jgi:hypothetical protein
MANLDPQVQIKLIEISKEWAEEIANKSHPSRMPQDYPKEFDSIYKQLVKTISEG